MEISLQPALLTGFLLVMARTFGFVFVAQPFALAAIPRAVRVSFAMALAIAGASHMARVETLPTTTFGLMGAMLAQLVVGWIVGYVTNVFINLGSSAGSAVGLFGGFSPPPSLDPLSLNQSPVTGQLYGLLWMTMFFISGADTVVVQGLLTLDGTKVLGSPELGMVVIVKSVSVVMGASIQIAAPILSVLFLSQVIVGILVKVSPQLNAYTFVFPLQILLSLGLMMLSLALLPEFLASALQYILAAESDLLGLK